MNLGKIPPIAFASLFIPCSLSRKKSDTFAWNKSTSVSVNFPSMPMHVYNPLYSIFLSLDKKFTWLPIKIVYCEKKCTYLVTLITKLHLNFRPNVLLVRQSVPHSTFTCQVNYFDKTYCYIIIHRETNTLLLITFFVCPYFTLPANFSYTNFHFFLPHENFKMVLITNCFRSIPWSIVPVFRKKPPPLRPIFDLRGQTKISYEHNLQTI